MKSSNSIPESNDLILSKSILENSERYKYENLNNSCCVSAAICLI